MAASVWKGSISFGLLSIPIRLFPAARSERINLHQIHKKCHTRLRQPLYCPTCHRIVERSEVVKGYEYEKGHYILIENEELRKITPPSGKTMEIQRSLRARRLTRYFLSRHTWRCRRRAIRSRTFSWSRPWKTLIVWASPR